MIQHSHLYMTTGKTRALTIQSLVSKVMSLLLNMLSRFVIAFLPRSKHLYSSPNHRNQKILSVQFSSVTQSCPTLCKPMECSTPGLPLHQQLLEPTQTHGHCVSSAIQPSHPPSTPYPPTFDLPQHQSLFQWVGSSHQVAKVLESQLQHQPFQWIFRTDFL